MHVLDYSAYYTTPQHDYLHLPRGARTNSTRVRWWQALESDARHHVGWTLDDVYIGGSKINPSELYENFDGTLDPEKWESHPNCKIRSTVCQRKNVALYWDRLPGDVRGVTTRQLIVQSGHMLQFKVTIHCGRNYMVSKVERWLTKEIYVYISYFQLYLQYFSLLAN